MTIAVFTVLAAGRHGARHPIAFALLVCGVALMCTWTCSIAQILAQNIINGADSFPLLAVPSSCWPARS